MDWSQTTLCRTHRGKAFLLAGHVRLPWLPTFPMERSPPTGVSDDSACISAASQVKSLIYSSIGLDKTKVHLSSCNTYIDWFYLGGGRGKTSFSCPRALSMPGLRAQGKKAFCGEGSGTLRRAMSSYGPELGSTSAPAYTCKSLYKPSL